MALIVRALRVKGFSIVVRVTWDVKQAARLAGAGDEVFVKVGADVARETMARRNVKILVLDMFAGLWGGESNCDINCWGREGRGVMNGMCEFGTALLDDGTQTTRRDNHIYIRIYALIHLTPIVPTRFGRLSILGQWKQPATFLLITKR